ncbi:hypothetical protein GTA08_BOTSDO00515 [Neofusicoccum parvum]|nr:hypothetical protein GTA08_BOTSDO00515 [Neofusicoccum parvum]
MSSNLMDTEPGGRNTQYESIKTVTNPPAKEPGQLGGGSQPSDNPTSPPASAGKTATTHVSAADKIRFGQALSEHGGVSGHTAPDHAGGGSARQEGGYGGAERLESGSGGDGEAARRAQGYGGERDAARDVGA